MRAATFETKVRADSPTDRMNRRHDEWREALPSTTRCLLCPEWSFEGTVAECRVAHAEHLAAEHPELVGRKAGRRRRRKAADETERCSECRINPVSVTDGPQAGLCRVCADRARRESSRAVRGREQGAEERAEAVSSPPPARRAASRAAMNGRVAPIPDGRTQIRRPISADLLDEIARRNREGESLSAIARSLRAEIGSVTENAAIVKIGKAMKLAGIPVAARRRRVGRPVGSGRASALTPDRVARVNLLMRAGLTVSMVASLAYEPWGYKNRHSCEVAIQKKRTQLGVARARSGFPVETPYVNRAEARAILGLEPDPADHTWNRPPPGLHSPT